MINCKIANVKFRFSLVSNLMKNQLEKYVTNEQGEINISSEIVDKINVPQTEAKFHSKYYDVYQDNDDLIQIQKNENNGYIGAVIYKENSAIILMKNGDVGRKEYLLTEYACLYFILKHENAILIHSSSIQYKDKGILFIASSGVGKSTQARLWKEHLNITQINDDKNIIIEEKDGLYIYGNPWSGKSLIDINTKVKLTNLVFVHRNTSPSVREVTKKEGFLYLMPHITNSSFMYNREKWNQLTNKLIEINACVLNCNISYDSVDTLKQYLEETK